MAAIHVVHVFQVLHPLQKNHERYASKILAERDIHYNPYRDRNCHGAAIGVWIVLTFKTIFSF